MGALWAVRADYEARLRRASTGPLAMALVVVVVVVQAATAGPCPWHCVCADSVQWFELKCARPHGYNLTVTIQPGYYYILECDSSDERALDPGELSPLREALGDYTYNSTTVLRCVVPTRPLAELLVALHPAAGAELVVVKLEEPRGAIPDTVGLAALRQFIIIRATLNALPPTVLAVDHLIVSRSLEPLRLGADTLRPATGSRPLRTLELSRDNITELPPRVFVHVSELRRLFLWGNHLEAVSSESFAGLRSLEALDLSRNRLKTLPQALCGAMPALRTLNLYGNPLTVVAEDTFARCAALKVLKVTHGRLKNLPFTVFMGSNAIQNLSLASQRLETLSAELFRDQHDLRHLDLSGNLLTRLAPDVFSGLGRLTHLSLDGNLLEELGRGVFSGLNSLEELSVERNRLERIAADAFRGAGAAQMRRLRLAQNLLTLREGAAEGASPLRALTGLQSLHLARNLIDFVYDDWRFGMLQLRSLDLSYNRFTALTYLDVNFLAMKTDIDFRHNNISKLDFAAAEAEAYTTESVSVSNDITVWLDDNPLRCDCEMYSVLRADTPVPRPRIEWGQAECVAPPVLRGVPLASLSADGFTCELDSCNATNCTCRARPAERILEVQCMGAVRLPRLEPAVVGARWRLERTEMILNGSNIDHFGPQDPAPDVTVLDLRDNRLSRLDAASVRRLLAPRRVLWLAGNPIECDCDNEPLLRSLREHHLQVRDYERLRCADGKLIQDLLPGELCVGLTVPIAAALALLAALVAVLVLLYRRFESEAKVWLYARGLCLRCLTEEELDRDKRYDAFISFSHLDEAFVVGELVPTLETGPHPLRLCVHVRDWPAGEWIPAQIARSVEQSCRTIVVLSPNFLESVWGRVEFRAAHAAALREGRARVVVVLYGEALDARQLDPELRAYLATNTYIKWGDPYFWHKLRLELPHRRTPNRLVECAPPLTELVAARKAGFQDGLELRPASTAPVHAL